MNKIKFIGLDADDTLWVNEPYYRETEQKIENLLEIYCPKEKTRALLYQTEMQNLSLYGYGIKSFILSCIETALKISDYKADAVLIEKIMNLGKEMLSKDIELLDGVKESLELLSKDYTLILATKGDLLDQERKLIKSGLSGCFHHIEVMSDKKKENYEGLLNHLDIEASEFLMVGNSVRSDILPIIELGGKAVHIPYHTTWIHENVEISEETKKQFTTLENIALLPGILSL